MTIPPLTKNRLKSIGIYRKMTPDLKKLLREGARVEMEHTSNPLVAIKIANDHIRERKDYYKRLKKFVEK